MSTVTNPQDQSLQSICAGDMVVARVSHFSFKYTQLEPNKRYIVRKVVGKFLSLEGIKGSYYVGRFTLVEKATHDHVERLKEYDSVIAGLEKGLESIKQMRQEYVTKHMLM